MRITTKQKEPIQEEEEYDKRDFLALYLDVKEEKRQPSEQKACEWMDTKIKIKEVDISIDN